MEPTRTQWEYRVVHVVTLFPKRGDDASARFQMIALFVDGVRQESGSDFYAYLAAAGIEGWELVQVADVASRIDSPVKFNMVKTEHHKTTIQAYVLKRPMGPTAVAPAPEKLAEDRRADKTKRGRRARY